MKRTGCTTPFPPDYPGRIPEALPRTGQVATGALPGTLPRKIPEDAQAGAMNPSLGGFSFLVNLIRTNKCSF